MASGSTQRRRRRPLWAVLEWFLLGTFVMIYHLYLQSTIEVPSDNEILLFGQHQLTNNNKGSSSLFHREKHNPHAALTVVIRSTEARLGNNMFQYASAVGILRTIVAELSTDPSRNKLCMHPRFGLSPLEKTVVGPLVPNCTSEDMENVWEVSDAKYATHYKIPFPACEGDKCTYSLKGYFQSFKYFEECCENHIRSIFKFQPLIQAEADRFLNTIKDAPIKIGIHVRKGDMNRKYFYLRDPPLSYYQKAMDHFLDRYGSIRFLVASDDPDWCEQQTVFAHDHVTVMRNHTGPVDLAILSRCQNVIMSRGSFGWWAAWLSRGAAVYYKNVFVVEHPENKGKVQSEDHYPSHWVGME